MAPMLPAITATALVLALLQLATASSSRNLLGPGATGCQRSFGKTPITFLFFADPGTYSGSAEAKYILANTKSLKQIHNFDGFCGTAFTGKIMSKKVAIITTGIGPMQALGCTQKVLDDCSFYVAEAIYMGAAGFSQTFGGVLNPNTGCDHVGTHRGKGDIVRLGDLCISPYAVNWDCKLASWSDQANGFPNQCTMPLEEFGPDASFLYGECIYTSAPQSALDLSAELWWAATHPDPKMLPNRTAAWKYETEYWEIMNNGSSALNASYYLYAETDLAPTVFDWTQCAEVDSQFFFSGPPYEWVNRNIAALTLNIAHNVSNYNSTNVVAANAMEAIGFVKAFQTHNSLSVKKIPYANMRGTSNYSTEPVKYMGNATWAMSPFAPDHPLGYATAIASYSTAMLQMLKNRCLLTASDQRTCSFTIDTSV